MHTDSRRPVTIVTGASRGIGAAVAERLARDGHDLVLTYRDREQDALQVMRACEASGSRLLLLQVDMADLDAAATVVPSAVERFGTVTGLVNNAGITGLIGGFLDANSTPPSTARSRNSAARSTPRGSTRPTGQTSASTHSCGPIG
uniref:SDR family NAD(P)-dependent oxidoreductase n=1 Tax=Agromyces humi TaxID=1766800 RepID=UPI00193959C8